MSSDYTGNYIAEVEIDFDNGQGSFTRRKFIIVAPEIAESHTDRLSRDDPLAKSILKAHEHGLNHFIYKGRDHRIVKCQLTIANEQRENMDPCAEYRLHEISSQIHVQHDARCWVCFRQPQELKSVTALVNRSIPINVLHCPRCGSYFVDKESFKMYEKLYGPLGVSLIEYREERQQQERNALSPESALMKAGYSVERTFFRSERQDKLCGIMANGIITKEEIIRHLNDLIRMNRSNPLMQRALIAWNDDLLFVNNLNLDVQPIIVAHVPLPPSEDGS